MLICTGIMRPCFRPGDVITPDDVFDAMEADLKLADMILWVGISFEQSASTSYFRKVRRCNAGVRVQPWGIGLTALRFVRSV